MRLVTGASTLPPFLMWSCRFSSDLLPMLQPWFSSLFPIAVEIGLLISARQLPGMYLLKRLLSQPSCWETIWMLSLLLPLEHAKESGSGNTPLSLLICFCQKRREKCAFHSWYVIHPVCVGYYQHAVIVPIRASCDHHEWSVSNNSTVVSRAKPL